MDHAFVRHEVHSSVTPGAVFSQRRSYIRDLGIERKKRGYNHSRNKVSQAVVERLSPPPHGSEFRDDGHGNFSTKMKEDVY